MNAPEDKKTPPAGTGGEWTAASGGQDQRHQDKGLGKILPDLGGVVNDYSLVPDPGEGIDLLKGWRPDGPTMLASIDPQGGVPKVYVADPTVGATRNWIADREGRLNLYWTPNRVLSLNAKPNKGAVVDFSGLWVDVDPKSGETPQDVLERVRAVDYPHPPTVTLISGGGVQMFWKLRKPLPVGGSPDLYRIFGKPNEDRTADDLALIAEHEARLWAGEGRYKALAETFGGDVECRNADRIMRLPGTWNLPTKAKIKGGRTEKTVAHLIEVDWSRLYDLEDFPEAESVPGTGPAVQPKVVVTAIAAADVDLAALPICDRTRALIVNGGDPDDPAKWSNRSNAVWHVACELVRAGVTDDLILGVLLDPDLAISAHVYDQPQPESYARRQVERARTEVAKDPAPALVSGEVWPVLGGGPMDHAHVYHKIDRFLVYYADEWLRWDGHAYRALTEGEVRAAIWKFLHASKRPAKEQGEQALSFCPKKRDVDDLIDALKAVVGLDHRIAEPCWIDGRAGPDPLSVVVCRNGLLDLATGDLMPPSPAFFARSGLAFDYDPDGPEPETWMRFLGQLWPGDEGAECIAALRRFMGYLLTPDTRYQKALMLVGAKRAGKGLIGKVIRALVGEAYTAAPTLNEFGGSFPLAGLLTARVALISDFRMGRYADESMIAETLLRVTGEDLITVARKYKAGVDTTLAVRFVVLSNELPKWGDSSGALASRFVVLPTAFSAFGNEDPDLGLRLLAEAPGILRWAMEGWRANRRDARLIQPEVGRAMVDDMIDLASPVAAFIRERCDLGPDERVDKDLLFRAFADWHERVIGQPYRSGPPVFARDLYAATGNKVASVKLREGETRVPAFSGIGLAAAYGAPDGSPPF